MWTNAQFLSAWGEIMRRDRTLNIFLLRGEKIWYPYKDTNIFPPIQRSLSVDLLETTFGWEYKIQFFISFYVQNLSNWYHSL